MIEARGLTRRFGSFTAVDRIDLDIRESGIVGFLGPNGAGKTTTMRMLTGFLPISDGTARVAGFDVFDQPLEVKARVGYLPETPPLYPELSVGEYLRFVAEIRGVPRARRLSRIGEVMEQVGLRGWEGRLAGSLSKGYRQRVGLAQALIHNPPVLILDEPTVGLDPAQLVGIRGLIADLARDRLVVLSTHILQEVELLCSRVILIAGGRIVGDGGVDELAAAAGAGPWVELEVVGAGDGAAGRLSQIEALTSVEELEAVDGRRRFRLEGEEDLSMRVAEVAQAESWRIHQLARHRSSLERVFLSLVRSKP